MSGWVRSYTSQQNAAHIIARADSKGVVALCGLSWWWPTAERMVATQIKRKCKRCLAFVSGHAHIARPMTPGQVFKPWIVRRPGGQCQVLFPLSELDGLVEDLRRLWQPPNAGNDV